MRSSKERKKRRKLIHCGDGCYLKFRLAWEERWYPDAKGNKGPFRTYTDRRVYANIEIARQQLDKRWLSLVDGRKVSYGNSEKYYNIIFLDLDKLPPGFETFYDLDLELSKSLTGKGVSIGSFSHKTKWAFRVLCPEKRSLTKNQALSILYGLIDKRFHDYIDTNGVFFCYLHSKPCIKKLRKLKDLPPIKEIPSQESAVYTTTYWESGEEIPDLIKSLIRSTKEERFYRIILAMSHLTLNGFGISTKVLAAQLKISPRTASTWLKRAIKHNLLQCLESKFIPFQKARTYRATELLAKFIRPFKKAAKLVFPEAIPAGKWHSTLHSIVRKYVGSLPNFLMELSKIPGFENKDRRRQAESIFNWHKRVIPVEKYNNKPTQPVEQKMPEIIELNYEQVKKEYNKYRDDNEVKISIFKKLAKQRKVVHEEEVFRTSVARSLNSGEGVIDTKFDRNWNAWIQD